MFLNPLMLAGLGGAMLPVVLHLLSRSRFRTVDWAAMMFLQGLDPRQRQSTRLKQLILLLLRMAVVGLLAVALARPVVSDSFAAIASGGHVSAVMVVDGSASTTLVEKGKPRSERIRHAAIQILSSLHKGDEAAVVVAGATQQPAPRMTTELNRVADEIGAIQPAGRANLADAFARAAELLDRPQALNRRLYVIVDRQAVSWREIDTAYRNAWRERARRDAAATALTIVPVGGSAADNLAVESIAVVNPPLMKDQPADVEVKIRNYGPVRRAGVPVALSINGREVGRATVDCGPDSTVTARVSLRTWESGPQLITAALTPGPKLSTGMAADDSLDYALDIADPIRVLIASGDERRPRGGAESFFATAALQPFAASGRHGADPCKVTVMPAEALAPADLDACDVLLLANVATVSPALGQAIEQWVYDGGGLLVAPGGLTLADSFNEHLYRGGSGVLPASLRPPADDPPPAELANPDLSHPTLRFLRGRGDLPPVSIGRHFKLVPRPEARVVVGLDGGDPLAVESTAGRGRVITLAIPVDADWSTLPLTSFYLPFLQSSVRWLAGTSADRNLPLGSTLSYTYGGESRAAALTQPDGRTITVEPQRQGDRNEYRYPDADQPGVYRLRIPTGKRDLTVQFVVAGPADESDPKPMRRKDWDALARDLNAEVIDPHNEPLAQALKTNRTGREAWGAMVLAVIALGLFESWLAGRWSRQD